MAYISLAGLFTTGYELLDPVLINAFVEVARGDLKLSPVVREDYKDTR
jgi:hypothetical protein